MINYFVFEWFYVKWKLSCRHRNVLKSMEKVKALSWLAEGNPHRQLGLYLTTAINKSIHNLDKKKYSRGNKATWGGKVENDKIITINL